MRVDRSLHLLGGLSPALFMERHWQRKPLLVRGAWPGAEAMAIERSRLMALAAQDEVESRLVRLDGDGWTVQHGPLGRRSLPARAQPGWTLLVQGMDLHEAAVHAALQQFRFVPDARLDDVMVSWASDQGGVGPHFDSYDVFLLQVQGRRRWRWGRQRNLALRADVPLKILADFEPRHEAVLEPGDMLYLPPDHAHEGVADGECQTWSIGFRAPARDELGRELLARLSEDAGEAGQALYRDAGQDATSAPGAIPPSLREFARDAVADLVARPRLLERALGEYLTEPKAHVWFQPQRVPPRLGALALDARSRMMYDERHVFINGESWRASGPDAALMRRLANARGLSAPEVAQASDAARELLAAWCEAGWIKQDLNS